MVNWVLGFLAAALWCGAYGWYFSHDIRRWLWRRRHRRALAARERAEAYAAWMRRPSRPSRPPPATPSPPPPPPRPPGEVIPFPRRDRAAPRQ